MRLASLIAAALTVSSGVAFAEPSAGRDAPSAPEAIRQVFVCDSAAESSRAWLRECAGRSAASDQARRVARQVFMCDRTAAARRAWMREYGEMTFVTADEFARAEASNEGWSTPRCMTRSELRRVAKGMPGTAMARALVSASSM